jgi:acyl carrier protein
LWEEDSEQTARLDQHDRQRINDAGVLPLKTSQALAALDTAVALPQCPAVVAVALHRPTLRTRARNGTLPAQLRGLVPVSGRPTANTTGQDLRQRLAQLPVPQQGQFLLSTVRAEVAAVLGQHDSETIISTQDFKELGFDSLTAVELRNRLNNATGLKLPASTIFDHPNPRTLTNYLLSELTDSTGDQPSDDATVRSALATIPLDTLRDHGLLDRLLQLVGRQPAASTVQHSEDQIDSMDLDALVAKALGPGDS